MLKINKNSHVTIPEIWVMSMKTIFCGLKTSITFAILLQITRFLVHSKAEPFSFKLHKGSKVLSSHVNTLHMFKQFWINSAVGSFADRLQMWCLNGKCRGRTHLFDERKIEWFDLEMQKLLMFEDFKILSSKSWAKFQVLLQVGFWWFSAFIVSTLTNICV